MFCLKLFNMSVISFTDLGYFTSFCAYSKYKATKYKFYVKFVSDHLLYNYINFNLYNLW